MYYHHTRSESQEDTNKFAIALSFVLLMLGLFGVIIQNVPR